MKGMLDFLEKAGLVRKDAPVQQVAPEIEIILAEPAVTPEPVAAPALAAAPVAGLGVPLNLSEIYASQGIGPALYPAERLLRLLDGLSAMDEATRQMAIKAMDAADESWTIDDPLADAAVKLKALAVHSASLQASLQQREQETQAALDAVATRQEQVVGGIRKQIAELEALAARELARSAQETAAQEASLKVARDQIASDLAEIARVSQGLQSLSQQFGASTTSTSSSQE